MTNRLLIAAGIVSIGMGMGPLSGQRAASVDWSKFRGPGGLGVSSQTGLPAQWNETSCSVPTSSFISSAKNESHRD